MKLQHLLPIALLFAARAVWASGGEHHADAGIPWRAIFFQAMNFGLLLAVLAYLTRKKMVSHFKERHQLFQDLVGKAESAKAAAEAQRRTITERLAKLESQADENLRQAKAEAEELRLKILREAEELSKNLEEEARRTVTYEVARARTQLRHEILGEAIELARKNMSTSVGASDQKRLQSEFVEKIQVVR